MLWQIQQVHLPVEDDPLNALSEGPNAGDNYIPPMRLSDPNAFLRESQSPLWTLINKRASLKLLSVYKM